MTDYQVVRSRRRTVALQVDQSGSVVVRAPMTLPAEEIRTFVEKHETWIHRQQQRQARGASEIQASRIMTDMACSSRTMESIAFKYSAGAKNVKKNRFLTWPAFDTTLLNHREGCSWRADSCES